MGATVPCLQTTQDKEKASVQFEPRVQKLTLQRMGQTMPIRNESMGTNTISLWSEWARPNAVLLEN